MKVTMKIFPSCLVTMSFLVTTYLILYFRGPLAYRNNLNMVCSEEAYTMDINDMKKGDRSSSEQDGLVPPGIDRKSCLSRFESRLYRKVPPHKHSPYLVSKLRAYEELHRRCGPDTESYRKAARQLDPASGVGLGPTDCNYVVYVPQAGIGNRILSITATFLYALLTDRVLLISFGDDFSDLFCEPFPGRSWSLPRGFPLEDRFGEMNARFPQSFGNRLRNHTESDAAPYVYVHLVHDYHPLDKLFFCDEHQRFVSKVPWLVFKSNNYFVPSFFLMPSFEDELTKLFPEKGTVFHHLGRYLFSPSNGVWDHVKRYYQAYLAKSDEIIGIQIRTFDKVPGSFQYVKDQIFECVTNENLLPKLSNFSRQVVTGPRRKAVLVTSLSSDYSETLKELYWQNPTSTGDAIGVHQPSHEETQKFRSMSHNSKAWVEMYLLSLVDVLVTSGQSTFGYVAQGLGGLTPWVLPQAVNRTVPDPACIRVGSMEPCFHAAPIYDCKAKRKTDLGLVVPHVRHCEDVTLGLKLFDNN